MGGPVCAREKELIDEVPTFFVSLAGLSLLQFLRTIFIKLLREWAWDGSALDWETSMLVSCKFRLERYITARAIDYWLSVNSIEMLPAILSANRKLVPCSGAETYFKRGISRRQWVLQPRYLGSSVLRPEYRSGSNFA
jgi:hypothetical protein